MSPKKSTRRTLCVQVLVDVWADDVGHGVVVTDLRRRPPYVDTIGSGIDGKERLYNYRYQSRARAKVRRAKP